MNDPFAQLERSHRRLEERLDELLQASASPRAEDAREVVRDVAAFLSRAVRRHEEDEERSLFPRLTSPELAPVIERLAREHREHERLHARLQALVADGDEAWGGAAAGELAETADALVAAYRAHIEEEERALFPAARATLSPEDLDAMSREMEERRGRGPGPGAGSTEGGGGGGGRRR